MFERILVPLDGSVLAEQALSPAIKIAEATGAELLLIRAVEMDPVLMLDPIARYNLRPVKSIEELQKEAEQYLGKVKNIRSVPGVEIDFVVERSDPALAILNTAQDEPCDLIVMTTHGLTGIDRWMYGSVTEKVMRHAPCPLLVLRTNDIPSHFLISLDGSEQAEAILPPAVALAQVFGSDVTLIRVETQEEIPSMEQMGDALEVRPGLYNEVKLNYERMVWKYLEKTIQEKFADTELSVSYDIDSGNPADRILATANRDACDLIAMSTHGRTGLSRWRYGSVTEKVLRNANRAMLIVRPAAHLLSN